MQFAYKLFTCLANLCIDYKQFISNLQPVYTTFVYGLYLFYIQFHFNLSAIHDLFTCSLYIYIYIYIHMCHVWFECAWLVNSLYMFYICDLDIICTQFVYNLRTIYILISCSPYVIHAQFIYIICFYSL